MRRKLTRLFAIFVAAAAVPMGTAGSASAAAWAASGYKVCPNGQHVRIRSTHSPPRIYTHAYHVFYSSSNDKWIWREHGIPPNGGTIRTPTWRQSAYWRVWDNTSIVTAAGADCVPI